MAEANPHGVPLARIAALGVGDEVLIGPDFYATIVEVKSNGFVVCTEYGSAMGVTAAAIEAIP